MQGRPCCRHLARSAPCQIASAKTCQTAVGVTVESAGGPPPRADLVEARLPSRRPARPCLAFQCLGNDPYERQPDIAHNYPTCCPVGRPPDSEFLHRTGLSGPCSSPRSSHGSASGSVGRRSSCGAAGTARLPSILRRFIPRQSVVCVGSECCSVRRGKALGRSWSRSRRHLRPEVLGSPFRHGVLPQMFGGDTFLGLLLQDAEMPPVSEHDVAQNEKRPAGAKYLDGRVDRAPRTRLSSLRPHRPVYSTCGPPPLATVTPATCNPQLLPGRC
ncbi:hypothetical protein M2275_002932 [Rhodococcus opacus]|nr:hypothetical protein [Rhodococcus opacus]